MCLTSEWWWIYNNLYCTNTLNLNVLFVCCVYKFVYLISFGWQYTPIHHMTAKWWRKTRSESKTLGIRTSFLFGTVRPPRFLTLTKLKFFSTHFLMVSCYTFKLFESVCYAVVLCSYDSLWMRKSKNKILLSPSYIVWWMKTVLRAHLPCK